MFQSIHMEGLNPITSSSVVPYNGMSLWRASMHDSMTKLQYSFQKAILDRFKTGHLLVDYFLTSTVFEPLGAFRSYQGYVSYASLTFQRLWRFFRWLYKVVKSLILSKGNTLGGPTSRTVEIHYITPKSRKNHIYEKVQWFLESAVETANESQLIIYCEDPLQPEAHPPPAPLQKSYPTKQAKSYTFEYKEKSHVIHFEFTKETITVYGDKERKKEDLIIRLWIEDPSSLGSEDDVIEAFIQKCIHDHRRHYAAAALRSMLYTAQGTSWTQRTWRNRRKLSTIVLKEGQMDVIKDQLDWFMANEDWYAQRGLPYKLIFLFHGPPGTGKSAMMNGISTYLKRPYRHNLSLSAITSDSAFRSLTDTIDYSSTVVYCDDLDTLNDVVLDRAHKKKKEDEKDTVKKDTLKLGTLLEWMDGDMCHGLVAGFMTNFPERLDSAFVREGRIDLSERLDFCDDFQLRGLFQSFYGRLPNGIDEKTWSPSHLSPAAVQKIFRLHRQDPEKALEVLETYKPHYQDIHSKTDDSSSDDECKSNNDLTICVDTDGKDSPIKDTTKEPILERETPTGAPPLGILCPEGSIPPPPVIPSSSLQHSSSPKYSGIKYDDFFSK